MDNYEILIITRKAIAAQIRKMTLLYPVDLKFLLPKLYFIFLLKNSLLEPYSFFMH